jgi:hypothetical protein
VSRVAGGDDSPLSGSARCVTWRCHASGPYVRSFPHWAFFFIYAYSTPGGMPRAASSSCPASQTPRWPARRPDRPRPACYFVPCALHSTASLATARCAMPTGRGSRAPPVCRLSAGGSRTQGSTHTVRFSRRLRRQLTDLQIDDAPSRLAVS